MRIFLEFPDDEVLVAVEEVAAIRALTEESFDSSTGRPMRPIPADALTRIDTRSAGHFYVREDFTSVRSRLAAAHQLLGESGPE